MAETNDDNLLPLPGEDRDPRDTGEQLERIEAGMEEIREMLAQLLDGLGELQ